jgi:hypothetical protein
LESANSPLGKIIHQFRGVVIVSLPDNLAQDELGITVQGDEGILVADLPIIKASLLLPQ